MSSKEPRPLPKPGELPQPTKHVFVPLPPSDMEQMAWSVADSASHAAKQHHDSFIVSQEQNAELQKRVEALTADNARLTAELSELRRLVNRHDHDYLAVHKELDKAHAENASLRERVAELEAKLSEPCVHDRLKESLDAIEKGE